MAEQTKPQGSGNQGSQGGQPQKQTYVYPASNEFTAEFVSQRLGPLMFNPIKELVRCRFNKGKLIADEHASPSISALPEEIPGLYLTMNIEQRRAEIFDPLELPEHRETLERITIANKTGIMAGGAVGTPAGVTPRRIYESMTGSDLKTWLCELRKLLDNKRFRSREWRDNPAKWVGGPMLVMISGSLATMEQIEAMPFDRRVNFFSNSHTDAKAKKFADVA